MSNYLIATCLSVVTACFTAAASWVPDKEKTYLFQVAQCLVYAAASYFYGVYTTIITMFICAARNYLAAKDRFTLNTAIVFSVLGIGLGIIFNNSGLVGVVPIAATVVYNFGCCICKKLVAVKWNIIINLLFWMTYDAVISDFASLLMDTIGMAAAVAAILRIAGILKSKKTENTAGEES